MVGNIYYRQISVWRWKQTTFTPLLPVICALTAAEMSHSPQIEKLSPHINIKFPDSGLKVSAFFLFVTFESRGRSNKKLSVLRTFLRRCLRVRDEITERDELKSELENVPWDMIYWNAVNCCVSSWSDTSIARPLNRQTKKSSSNKAWGRYRVSFIFSVFLLWIEPIISSLYFYGRTRCPEIKLYLLWLSAWVLLSS